MKDKIEELLYSVGAFEHYKGYSYFVQAVSLAAENPERLTDVCKEIYAPVAETNHTTVSNVNKNIRTLRDRFWENGGKERLIEWTGCSAWKEQKPYPKEFIGIMVRLLENGAEDDSTRK